MRADQIAEAGSTWVRREEGVPLVGRRENDATKLTLPLPAVVAIVGTVLAAAVFMLTAQMQLQSDVRVVLERQEADRRVAEVTAKLAETNAAQLKADIVKATNRLDLYQLQIGEMQRQLTVLTQGRK
jgi:hypothetical protein